MSRVDEIDERAKATSPGPWEASSRDVSGALNSNEGSGLGWEVDGPPEPMLRGEFGRGEDALFIAHARDDVPWLVARCRALEAGLALLADDDNWDYGDSGKYWFHRDANGQGTDAQEIARAALAGEG